MTVLRTLLAISLLLTVAITPTLKASDWPRFRGMNGSGVAESTKPIPEHWNESKNLKWSVELPGPGTSSPIVVGDRVFLTCWSGYGIDLQNPGNQSDLRRHLVCIDRSSCNVLWDRTVDPIVVGLARQQLKMQIIIITGLVLWFVGLPLWRWINDPTSNNGAQVVGALIGLVIVGIPITWFFTRRYKRSERLNLEIVEKSGSKRATGKRKR
jgi:hypothetical protein